MVDETTDMKLTVVTESETARRRLFHQCDCAVAIGERLGLPQEAPFALLDRLRQPDYLGFGLAETEIHGFASLPRDRLAFIVCNQTLGKNIAHAGICVVEQTD